MRLMLGLRSTSAVIRGGSALQFNVSIIVNTDWPAQDRKIIELILSGEGSLGMAGQRCFLMHLMIPVFFLGLQKLFDINGLRFVLFTYRMGIKVQRVFAIQPPGSRGDVAVIVDLLETCMTPSQYYTR